jgi:hypothetical protein
MNANHNQHKQARKVWAGIALKSFPFRHEKSMVVHGKAWNRWAKDHKIVNH